MRRQVYNDTPEAQNNKAHSPVLSTRKGFIWQERLKIDHTLGEICIIERGNLAGTAGFLPSTNSTPSWQNLVLFKYPLLFMTQKNHNIHSSNWLEADLTSYSIFGQYSERTKIAFFLNNAILVGMTVFSFWMKPCVNYVISYEK